MPVKKFFRSMQPAQLYVVLILTITLFIIELIVSHLTHALTLLMDSYHMLCNIMALAGCITTIKYGNNIQNPESLNASTDSIQEIALTADGKKSKTPSRTTTKQERKLRNTFGWTRIDVITMLICCVFLASFSFSIYVEALQTLTHIAHLDAMHQPVSVLCCGAAGLILNGICYLLIGGFTFHQGSFLFVTESGDVVLNNVVVNDSLKNGSRRLSRTKQIYSSPPKKRQGLWEMMRDIIGCALVIVCSIIVLFTDPEVAKYIDPLLSLVSATSIMTLSYPYIKESCMILLQTMPDTINIETMKKELVNHFPDIINVHDFHIWQLTASKVISTVHIIFENPKVYRNILEEVKEFFLENGVTQVTIQPEFFRPSTSMESLNSAKLPPVCLVACQGELCKLNHCCPSYEGQKLFKTTSKEILPTPERATPTLTSVRIIDEELHSLKSFISTQSLSSVEESEHYNSSSEIMKYVEKNTIKEEDVDAMSETQYTEATDAKAHEKNVVDKKEVEENKDPEEKIKETNNEDKSVTNDDDENKTNSETSEAKEDLKEESKSAIVSSAGEVDSVAQKFNRNRQRLILK